MRSGAVLSLSKDSISKVKVLSDFSVQFTETLKLTDSKVRVTRCINYTKNTIQTKVTTKTDT